MNANTAWAHLPNARHIDWVLKDFRQRPAVWDAARKSAREAARKSGRVAARGAAREAAWVAAWDAARGAARDAAWGAAWDAAWDAAWVASRGDARDAAREAAWEAIAALIAWDDCARFIDAPQAALQGALALEDSAAVLLHAAHTARRTT